VKMGKNVRENGKKSELDGLISFEMVSFKWVNGKGVIDMHIEECVSEFEVVIMVG